MQSAFRRIDLARWFAVLILIAVAVPEQGCTVQISPQGGAQPGATLPPLPPLAPGSTVATAPTTTTTAVTSQDIQVSVLRAWPTEVSGEAYDPSDLSGTPLTVTLYAGAAGASATAVATGVANLDGSDIPGVTRRGSAFRFTVSGLSVGEGVIVQAASTTVPGRVQTSAAVAIQTTGTVAAAPSTTAATTAGAIPGATAAVPTATTAVPTAPGATAVGTTAAPGTTAVPTAPSATDPTGLGALAGTDPNALAGLLGGASVPGLPGGTSLTGTAVPTSLPQPSDRDACFANQTLIEQSLNAYDTANPNGSDAGMTVQTLVQKGFLATIPDDPGQGAGSGARDYYLTGGLTGVSCRVHGNNLPAGTQDP